MGASTREGDCQSNARAVLALDVDNESDKGNKQRQSEF